jgi:hypothetical protein
LKEVLDTLGARRDLDLTVARGRSAPRPEDDTKPMDQTLFLFFNRKTREYASVFVSQGEI